MQKRKGSRESLRVREKENVSRLRNGRVSEKHNENYTYNICRESEMKERRKMGEGKRDGLKEREREPKCKSKRVEAW